MFAIFHPCKSGLVATLKLNCSRGGLFVEAKAIVASQNASHLGSGIAFCLCSISVYCFHNSYVKCTEIVVLKFHFG